VIRGYQNAQKMTKNWLRRLKIQRLKFDSIFFIDESPVDKENSI
jgi:hypothetical protein